MRSLSHSIVVRVQLHWPREIWFNLKPTYIYVYLPIKLYGKSRNANRNNRPTDKNIQRVLIAWFLKVKMMILKVNCDFSKCYFIFKCPILLKFSKNIFKTSFRHWLLHLKFFFRNCLVLINLQRIKIKHWCSYRHWQFEKLNMFKYVISLNVKTIVP